MGVRWDDLLRNGTEEEHARFWRLLAVCLTVLLVVLTFEVWSGESVDDGVCHEDESCWGCETMGNRICGPRSAP